MVFEEPVQNRPEPRASVTYAARRRRPGHQPYDFSADLTASWTPSMRHSSEIGVQWEYWSNETAPGEVEINLSPCPARSTRPTKSPGSSSPSARSAEERAARSASWPWGLDQHLGGGMHVNLSLRDKDGESAFYREDADPRHSEVLRRWVAGLLAQRAGGDLPLAPNVNSYRRLIEITGPPTTVTWCEGNKSVAVRTVDRGARLEPDRAHVPSIRLQHLPGPGDDPRRRTTASRTSSSRRRSSRAWPGGCRPRRRPGFHTR